MPTMQDAMSNVHSTTDKSPTQNAPPGTTDIKAEFRTLQHQLTLLQTACEQGINVDLYYNEILAKLKAVRAMAATTYASESNIQH